MIELSPDQIKSVKGDTILVRAIKPPEKIGRFYLPENVKEKLGKERKMAWKAVVVQWGAKVEFENNDHTLEKGQTLVLDPVSRDCPGFLHEEDMYVFVKDDDILAWEPDAE